MKVDFHVHTTASDGKNTIAEMVAAAKRKGLKAIAITDHDTLGWKNFKPREFVIIPGVEWTTEEGHVLLLGLSELPKSRNLDEVLDWARDWNVVPVAAHPYHLPAEHPLGEVAFEKFDIIEAINGRSLPWYCQKALSKALALDKKVVSNSDAHSIHQIGDYYNSFEETDSWEEILEKLRKGEYEPHMKMPSVGSFIAKKFI